MGSCDTVSNMWWWEYCEAHKRYLGCNGDDDNEEDVLRSRTCIHIYVYSYEFTVETHTESSQDIYAPSTCNVWLENAHYVGVHDRCLQIENCVLILSSDLPLTSMWSTAIIMLCAIQKQWILSLWYIVESFSLLVVSHHTTFLGTVIFCMSIYIQQCTLNALYVKCPRVCNV